MSSHIIWNDRTASHLLFMSFHVSSCMLFSACDLLTSLPPSPLFTSSASQSLSSHSHPIHAPSILIPFPLWIIMMAPMINGSLHHSSPHHISIKSPIHISKQENEMLSAMGELKITPTGNITTHARTDITWCDMIWYGERQQQAKSNNKQEERRGERRCRLARQCQCSLSFSARLSHVVPPSLCVLSSSDRHDEPGIPPHLHIDSAPLQDATRDPPTPSPSPPKSYKPGSGGTAEDDACNLFIGDLARSVTEVRNKKKLNRAMICYLVSSCAPLITSNLVLSLSCWISSRLNLCRCV